MPGTIVLKIPPKTQAQREAELRAHAFMDDFTAATVQFPLARHLRIWDDRALFEVKAFDGSIRLSCVFSIERGKGDGSAALEWLKALADQHDVCIKGNIDPVGQGGLTKRQLTGWYRRHSFLIGRGGAITYDPQLAKELAAGIASEKSVKLAHPAP